MATTQNIATVSNVELWNMARKYSPNFKSITSKGTADLFTAKGFEAIKLSNTQALNEYFDISMRIAFQMFTFANVKNPLENSGIVQTYSTPNGGFIQRIAVNQIKPISPKFRGLKDGDSVDPYVVRKPQSEERFFQKNFDYQNLITLQNFQVKEIFLNEYGMGEYLAGIMKQLEDAYKKQKYVNIKEVLNTAINSTNYPLQPSQIYATEISADSWEGATSEEYQAFLLNTKNVVSAMEAVPSSTAYNAAKFETYVDPSDMVLLMRAGVKNAIDTSLLVGAFNPEYLNIPVSSIVNVTDFGGLVPYADATFTTKVYPVYSAKFGNVVGYATQENATDETSGITILSADDVYWQDPNEDVVAVMIQRGAIFESVQNGYEVTPWYNPAGLYTNYWCNSPNNGINFDYYYSVIVFKMTQKTETTKSK